MFQCSWINVVFFLAKRGNWGCEWYLGSLAKLLHKLAHLLCSWFFLSYSLFCSILVSLIVFMLMFVLWLLAFLKTSHEVFFFCTWCYCEICFIMPRPRFFWAKCFVFLLFIIICISLNNNLLFITLMFRSQILVTLNPYLILCLGSVWSNGLFPSHPINVILFSLEKLFITISIFSKKYLEHDTSRGCNPLITHVMYITWECDHFKPKLMCLFYYF